MQILVKFYEFLRLLRANKYIYDAKYFKILDFY
jgi:hypothetical protein